MYNNPLSLNPISIGAMVNGYWSINLQLQLVGQITYKHITVNLHI